MAQFLRKLFFPSSIEENGPAEVSSHSSYNRSFTEEASDYIELRKCVENQATRAKLTTWNATTSNDCLKGLLKVRNIMEIGQSDKQRQELKAFWTAEEREKITNLVLKNRIDTALEGNSQWYLEALKELESEYICQFSLHPDCQLFLASTTFAKVVKELQLVKFDVDNFEYLNILGSGGFGCVFRARKKSTGEQYAIKVQPKGTILTLDENSICLEKNIMTALDSPFLPALHFSVQTPGEVVLVMDFVDGQCLKEVLCEARGSANEESVVRYFAEILLALETMHSVNIIHRDVKPENIVITKTGNAKLLDFGLAVPIAGCQVLPFQYARSELKYCGTRNFLAPEILRSELDDGTYNGYGPEVDIFAFGVSLFEVLAGYSAFDIQELLSPPEQMPMIMGQHGFGEEAGTNSNLFQESPEKKGATVRPNLKVSERDSENTKSRKRKLFAQAHIEMIEKGLTSTAALPAAAIDLVQKLIAVKPEERLTMEQIKAHSYFAGVDWNQLSTMASTKAVQRLHSSSFSRINKSKTYAGIVDAAKKKMSPNHLAKWVDGTTNQPTVEGWEFISQKAIDLEKAKVLGKMSKHPSSRKELSKRKVIPS